MNEITFTVEPCPETGATTHGKTIEEALSNLKEATELFLEVFPLAEGRRALLTSFQGQPSHA